MTAALAQEIRPLVKAQTLYLPIYSHMLYGNLGRNTNASSVLLSALVSIRNTDPRRPIRILSASSVGRLEIETPLIEMAS